MGQEILVIALRNIGSLVRAARFCSRERGMRDSLGHIQHEIKFERSYKFCVKGAAGIGELELTRSLSKRLKLRTGRL